MNLTKRCSKVHSLMMLCGVSHSCAKWLRMNTDATLGPCFLNACLRSASGNVANPVTSRQIKNKPNTMPMGSTRFMYIPFFLCFYDGGNTATNIIAPTTNAIRMLMEVSAAVKLAEALVCPLVLNSPTLSNRRFSLSL